MGDFRLDFKSDLASLGDKFRNPFNDFASKLMPDDLKQALNFAELIWFANSTFSKACSTVGRYFITEVEVDFKDDKKSVALKNFLEQDLNVLKTLSLLGDDFMCYGNSFWTVVLPFTRMLVCPKTGTSFPIEQAFKHNLVEWKDFKFKKTSKGVSKCDGHEDPFEIKDVSTKDVSKVVIKRWRPQDIDIEADEWSGAKTFYWKISKKFAQDIEKGKLTSLMNTPKEVIEAVKNKNERFEFAPGQLFHAADETISGVQTGGWGIPLVIRNFRNIYRSQLLDRYDEAVNLDYITGLRVISPATSGSGSAADPIKNMGMDSFSGHVQTMIKKHRMDPTTWHTSSFALQYQLMGAEGAQLTPVELKQRTDDNILSSVGVPAEMFKMNLQIQAAPLALRLFEKTWPIVQQVYNAFINFVTDTVAERFKHPKCKVSMKKVTLVDDISLPEILLQLMSGQQVSPQTALAGLGIGDYREEVRKVYEAEKIRSEEEAKFQDEMSKEQNYQDFKAKLQEAQMAAQQAAAGGGGGAPLDPAMAGGGAPQPGPMAPPAGPGSGVQVNQEALSDPVAMEQEAQRIAEEIFPLPNRRSIITDLTKTNNTLGAVVKEKLRQIEQQAASMGIQQAKSQGGV